MTDSGADHGSDSDNSIEQLQEFTLVEFVHRGRKKKVESVDIVPSKWLDFDKKRGRCTTKFLQTPYKEEDIEMLHKLVRDKVDAPEDWPVFPVEVKGRAQTYQEALKKITTLEKGGNVFTTDDESASEIQTKIHSAVRQQQLKKQEKLLQDKYFPNKTEESRDKSVEKQLFTHLEYDLAPSTSEVSNNLANASKQYDQSKGSSLPDCMVNTHETNEQATDHTVQMSSNSLPAVESPVENFQDLLQSNVSSEFHFTQLPFPEIQLEAYESKSDFETIVMTALNDIFTELKNINKNLEEIKMNQHESAKFLMDKKVVQKQNSKIDFVKKYELHFPVGDMTTFKTFDESLLQNTYLKNDVFLELTSLVDETVCISKTFNAMLKKFVSKNVALQFTAARKARDPLKENISEKFKETALFQCMSVVMTSASKKRNVDVSEKDLIKGLSAVLCNAKKWE